MSKRAATILVIRHGEKPADRGDPHLNARGRARARMVADRLPRLYPGFCALFAAASSKDSNRPYETIAPLAEKLGITINDSLSDGEHSRLATRILGKIDTYRGATVLICWHHEIIPIVARKDFAQESAPRGRAGPVRPGGLEAPWTGQAPYLQGEKAKELGFWT